MPNFHQTVLYIFVEHFASGDPSIVDAIYGNSDQICQLKDHEGFLEQMNSALEFITKDMDPKSPLEPDFNWVHRMMTGREIDPEFLKKNDLRLASELLKLQFKAYDDGPPLITAKSFKKCLAQYQTLCGYVEGLWNRSCIEYADGEYPMATFLSILAIEETGKLGGLWFDLMKWRNPSEYRRTGLGKLAKDHEKKQFLAVLYAAILSPRLTYLLGKETVSEILYDAEKGNIETLRRDCLYIGHRDGQPTLPSDHVEEEKSRTMLVLSGEVCLQILGFFPWDYDRMLKKVEEAEISVGLSKQSVQQASESMAILGDIRDSLAS